MFIGEGPGFNEDKQGRPFVGPAGKFLEELLSAIDMRREDVYITNIIKCRPPGNRDPLPEEVESCRVWLEQQMDLLDPALIVTLGRHSMSRFFPKETIGKVHGTARKVDGRTVFAMYHPAAALHQQRLRDTLIEDMKKIPGVLAQEAQVPEVAQEEAGPEQLSMF
jgi:DNA polymerase